jgi:hypothetical protein
MMAPSTLFLQLLMGRIKFTCFLEDNGTEDGGWAETVAYIRSTPGLASKPRSLCLLTHENQLIGLYDS